MYGNNKRNSIHLNSSNNLLGEINQNRLDLKPAVQSPSSIFSSITRSLDTTKRHVDGLVMTGAVDGHSTALVLLGDAEGAEDVACEDGGEKTVLLRETLV